MKKILSTITLFISLINSLFSSPMDGIWKQYIYTDGISSNYIFDVEKDNKGRVWIGTQNGVTLIEGKLIQKFGSSKGLPAANIIKVVSVNNKIYAATSTKGIYVLGEDGFFSKTSIVKGSSLSTMEKVGDKLFVSTNLENILHDGDNVSFMGKGFPNLKIKDVYVSGDKVWYVAEDRLIKKAGKSFSSEKITFSSNKVKIQAFFSDGTTDYFGTNQGLWKREGKGNPRLIKNINVFTLEQTGGGELLVGSKKGLYLLSKGKLKTYAPSGDENKEIKKTPIRDIKFISDNEIWYATFGMGLYLHDPGTFASIDKAVGLDPAGMVFDMVSKDNDIYVGTKNGLYVLREGRILKHFKKDDGLPSNMVLDLDVGIDGTLWLATANGLSKFTNSKFTNYKKKDGLPSKVVTAVHADRKNASVIWTGSEKSGLTRFDSGGFFTYAVQDGLPSNKIRSITQNTNGELVIACYDAGVATFDGKKFDLFNEGLDDKRVITLTEGPNGAIWAGTESAGIGILEAGKFTMIKDTDGLGHNEIFSLYYGDGKMWVGTFGGGVSCYSNETWFTLRESDGLISNTIGAIITSKNGKTFLGGTDGLSIFSENSYSFSVNFEKILSPKAEIINPDLQELSLSGIVGDRFYMTANPYVYNPSQSEIRFRTRVKLAGDSDVDWSSTQLSPQITFVSEGVGSYEFQVQAIDNRLLLSDIATIPFSISRVWYLDPKTAIPFWGAIVLLIGFSVVTYVNYRKKSKEAQDLRDAEIARQQAEMEEAREFQQAMLPKEMPSTDDYELVGFQQTATEVGGDFFDFMQKEDGGWVAICGDATGHGLTSGNVVSITKTAMSSLVEEDPVPTLDSLNTTLLRMNIGLNRMCLNIANLGKDSIKFSSAGMPPAYYYSAEKGDLEEILVGALPLGSLPGAMHMEQEISFKSSGDILVMMSDGLPEAENSEDEMVGYDRTLDTIKSLSDKSAVEIKDGLVELCNNWLGDDAELKDDMTFVIIKKK